MAHPDRPLYRYRFGDAEFHAARAALYVGGEQVDLERRPLQVLALLLEHVDEVVPRTELFDVVWEGRPTVDNVLANAVAKLRKALGATASHIVTVPRVGYRLSGPVERTAAERHAETPARLEIGQAVPGHPHFILRECLDPAGGGSVWLARHDTTGDPRVYKFATDGARLAALKREVAVYRVLRGSAGERDDFVRVVDWNFDIRPCWLQTEYVQYDLAGWMKGEQAFAEAVCEQRIAWFLEIAAAVAAAHRAGVLHQDLKPANLLVAWQRDSWRFRVADFGIGRLLGRDGLESLGITGPGLTTTRPLTMDAGMTPLYVAPEILAGAPPSVQSDVYALGLILFQMVAGDLRRALAPGWEQVIDDELLREDIAAATNGDPDRRTASVDTLIQRLLGREARAMERRRLRDSEARALATERALERARARRPWLLTTIVLLAAGLGVGLWQISRVHGMYPRAQQQATIAGATDRVFAGDPFGTGFGLRSASWGERDPTPCEVLDAAGVQIDRDPAADPTLRATLHNTLAQVYRSVGELDEAAAQLQAAAVGWRRVGGPLDERAVVAQYQLAQIQMDLLHLRRAKASFDRADYATKTWRHVIPETGSRAQVMRKEMTYQPIEPAPASLQSQAADGLRRQVQPRDTLLSLHVLLAMVGCHLRGEKPAVGEATTP